MPPIPPSQSSLSGTGQFPAADRETFAAEELAIVLSHYDIGIIQSVAKFPRGSRKAPKILITSDQGKFLLKRRARGKDDAAKVVFSHALQHFLADKQFPLPHLFRTKADNNSMLQSQGAVYELFEYIPGQSYPQTLEATLDAGRILGLFHRLLETFQSDYQAPSASYHNQPSIEHAFAAIPAATADLPSILSFLHQTYLDAAAQVESARISTWPRQYVHADWHPGNMLFRDNRVVAVIDYDSARLLPRILDIANGALQFSMIAPDDRPQNWPDYVDESRFKRFIRGYDQLRLLSDAEIHVMPGLMIQALIAESVLPIAISGSFGRIDGLPFLQMVQRKALWLTQSGQKLIDLLAV